MSDLPDTISTVSLEMWDAKENGLLSYVKTPIQTTFFTNNSDLIGKALRQAILYFTNTVVDADQKTCVLGTEFRSTRTHRYYLPPPADSKTSESTLMEVTTYAPIAFDYMRTIIGISRNDFIASFDTGELVNFANTGRSGSQMYKTQDDVYIIKTMRDHEAKLLIQSLPGLYLRYSSTSSLMTRYIGLYSVSMRSIFPTEIFCVVMLNNLPSCANVHEIYDLKGSSVGRQARIDHPSKRLKSLKDLDWQFFYPRGIRLPREIYRRLRIVIEKDIFELRKMMITDFSLILGIHQLDEYTDDKENSMNSTRVTPKPQLGLSALMAAHSFDRSMLRMEDDQSDEKTESIRPTDPKTIQRFIMKPLHLIACPMEDTFHDHSIASLLLGIPGVTENGRRVLLYPAIIDCLQTFDNFKRIQHTIQNIRDPKRGSEYSVIHPEEYEKRLLKFLFEKVFINSNQTLEELLASPILPPQEDDSTSQQRESFEVIQTTDVLQNLSMQPLTTPDVDSTFIESTAL